MERWGWISIATDPTAVAVVVLSVVLALLLLPSPFGAVLSGTLIVSVLWVNHRLDKPARRRPPRLGPEALKGQTAVVVEPLDPLGRVRCGGQLWQAVELLGRRVESGQRVTVVRVYQIQLEVERAEDPDTPAA